MKKLVILVLFICSISFAQEWDILLEANYHLGSDIYHSTRQIGVHPEATDGFDRGFDSAVPPFPPTFSFRYYLHCDDRIVNQLQVDIKSSLDDVNIWELIYIVGSPIPDSCFLIWDETALPSGWDFEITFVYPSEYVLEDNIDWSRAIDMHAVNRIKLPMRDFTGEHIAIRAMRSGSGVDEAKPEAFAVHVSPNPFNSVCNILTEPGAEIIISDITGKTIQSNKLPDNTSNYSWQAGNNLPSGVYNISVISENSTANKKVTFIK